ncbi:MAG: 60Kd inner membrane protein-domain-containing protein [Monoraphidium minutum]|nr:MAG: 60Kd inner membrane protein-domain-containing protein [Monoraphidium minutum]
MASLLSLPHALAALADAAGAPDAPPPPPDGGGGSLGWLAGGFEAVLEFLDGILEGAHVPYSYGFAIILLTILVKAATYPLTATSLKSSFALQALQPRVKELQARFANDPQALQLETARLYQDAGVNPLAGCLPTLATIPVFIGLYKALTQAADDGLLVEGFFWIPSLGGPATLAMRENGSGLSWLFPFVDGAPPVGWADAAAYLSLPVLLVASQFAAQRATSPPKSDDPATQQTQAVLKFLPLMIGWFSLNVPSGLSLYWLVNNIVSTGQQAYLRQALQAESAAAAPSGGGGGGSAGPIIDVMGSPAAQWGSSGQGAAGRPSGADGPVVEAEVVSGPPAGQQPGSSGGGGGSGRGSKFAARKAREAAAAAGVVAGDDDCAAAEPPPPARGSKFAARKAQEAAARAAAAAANGGGEGRPQQEQEPAAQGNPQAPDVPPPQG